MKVTRRVVQFSFLALTLVAVFVVGGNAESWCPFGGVEAFYQYVREGNLICSLGVSNFFILAAVLLITLLVRRAFCGYACPIGTLSEWLQRGATRIGLAPRRIPYGLDRGLALLKYAVLAVILYFTWRSGELVFRGYDPCYALLGRHGSDITSWAYVVSGIVVIASVFIVLPFCRWLCPLAAVLTPLARFGLARIKRDERACVDCGVCARACPMGIQVDRVQQVTAARCFGCFECTEACPERAGALHWGPPNWLARRWPRPVLVVLVLACLSGAVAATYAWPLPAFVQTWGEQPARTALLDLEVDNLTCRGRGTLLVCFLQRDDEYKLPGYMRLEAWPAPRAARLRLTYDPDQTNALSIKQAITEAYFDRDGGLWRASPYAIAGYEPLGMDE
jgi:polyferredoxin